MAAVTGCTTYGISPTLGRKAIFVVTPSTADSADTVDVSSAAATDGEVLSTVEWVVAYDQSSGDVVTATFSGTTITIDAAGGTTNHTYALLVIGKG
jgi:hypothetical protein